LVRTRLDGGDPHHLGFRSSGGRERAGRPHAAIYRAIGAKVREQIEGVTATA
jgi:hypothetical protein